MSIPATVTFHGVDTSDALRADVLERVRRLERFASDIHACRVTIDADGRGHRQGTRYRVRVQLTLRDGEIEAGGHAPADGSLEDPYVAVAATFDALRRRLEDHVRRRRGDVKSHAARTDGA